MIRLSNENTIFFMDKANVPIASCQSGDTVIFETKDCFSDQITNEEQALTSIDFNRVNPATGPLYVEGARRGDMLEIEILDIKVGKQGVMTAAPGLGALGESLNSPTTKLFPIEGDDVVYSTGLRLPLQPMIGVIGTAPPGEPINNGTPGPHGGNLDTKDIKPGTTVYLPVEVDGALLALGDLHAAMGDGEILICGVEIAGTVTLKVNVKKERMFPLPALKTDTHFMTIASAETLDAAAVQATKNMATFLANRTALSIEEAGMLLSGAGDLYVSQIVNPLKTARFSLALHYFEKLGVDLCN
jgi:amidase